VIRTKPRGGSLEIVSVNPSMIVERVETRAVIADYSVEVRAEFSLPPAPMEGILGPDARSHPCMVPAQGSDSRSSNGSSAGDDGSGNRAGIEVMRRAGMKILIHPERTKSSRKQKLPGVREGTPSGGALKALLRFPGPMTDTSMPSPSR